MEEFKLASHDPDAPRLYALEGSPTIHMTESGQPARLTIYGGEAMQKVASVNLRTGDVELTEGFTPTDAARAFWAAIAELAPTKGEDDGPTEQQ